VVDVGVGVVVVGVVVVAVPRVEAGGGKTVEPVAGVASSERPTGNVAPFSWLSTWVTRNERREV